LGLLVAAKLAAKTGPLFDLRRKRHNRRLQRVRQDDCALISPSQALAEINARTNFELAVLNVEENAAVDLGHPLQQRQG
jgi:hypothetical protein